MGCKGTVSCWMMTPLFMVFMVVIKKFFITPGRFPTGLELYDRRALRLDSSMCGLEKLVRPETASKPVRPPLDGNFRPTRGHVGVWLHLRWSRTLIVPHSKPTSAPSPTLKVRKLPFTHALRPTRDWDSTASWICAPSPTIDSLMIEQLI